MALSHELRLVGDVRRRVGEGRVGSGGGVGRQAVSRVEVAGRYVNSVFYLREAEVNVLELKLVARQVAL